MKTTDEIVKEWLDTFSPVEMMMGNPDALAREVDTIVGVFERDKSPPSRIDAAFQHIKMTTHSRAWPTAAQCFDALRHLRSMATGEETVGRDVGDRMTLDAFHLAKLENDILPRAKRWMRVYPGLRSHAVNTLEYWREPLIDDMGKDCSHFSRANRAGAQHGDR